MISGLILLSLMIVFHELGHFLAARLFGVRVEVFSLGFGRKLIGFTWRGTEYVLSLILLGGYVKLSGMEDAGIADGFASKNLLKRALIIIAGPAANFLLAFLILYAIALSGVRDIPAVIGGFSEQSRAAGILFPHDEILSINDHEVRSFGELRRFINAYNIDLSADEGGGGVQYGSNPSVNLRVKRGTQILSLNVPLVTLNEGEDGVQDKGQTKRSYMLGVSALEGLEPIIIKYSPLESLGLALSEFNRIFLMIFDGFSRIFTGQTQDLGGPVSIVKVMGEASSKGLIPFLFIGAVISINLGLLNLLPIPMLDGGYLLFYLLEFMLRRPLDRNLVNKATYVGLVLLLSLMSLGIYNDFIRMFQ